MELMNERDDRPWSATMATETEPPLRLELRRSHQRRYEQIVARRQVEQQRRLRVADRDGVGPSPVHRQARKPGSRINT